MSILRTKGAMYTNFFSGTIHEAHLVSLAKFNLTQKPT